MVKKQKAFHQKDSRNKISHAQSNIKGHTRLQILLMAGLLDSVRKIKLVNLGGVDFAFEKLLEFMGIDFDGISYEMEYYEAAKKNVPQNVELRKGNILKYKYNGNEDIIWFDFTHYVTTKSITQLLRWIDANPIKHSFTFAFTFGVRKPRNGGKLYNNYKKVFPKYKTHGVVNHVAAHIEKGGRANVVSSIIAPYKNVDVSAKSTDMCLYVLKVEKA